MAIQRIFPATLVALSYFLLQGQTNAQMLYSPCPRLFTYDPQNETDRWYGTLTLLSDVDLLDIWLRLTFDRTSHQLGNWFGQVETSDSKEYHIRKHNFELKANKPQSFRFFLKYNPREPIPRLLSFRLNGKLVCPEQSSSQSDTLFDRVNIRPAELEISSHVLPGVTSYDDTNARDRVNNQLDTNSYDSTETRFGTSSEHGYDSSSGSSRDTTSRFDAGSQSSDERFSSRDRVNAQSDIRDRVNTRPDTTSRFGSETTTVRDQVNVQFSTQSQSKIRNPVNSQNTSSRDRVNQNTSSRDRVNTYVDISQSSQSTNTRVQSGIRTSTESSSRLGTQATTHAVSNSRDRTGTGSRDTANNQSGISYQDRVNVQSSSSSRDRVNLQSNTNSLDTITFPVSTNSRDRVNVQSNSNSGGSINIPGINSQDRFNVQSSTTPRDVINSQSNVYSRDRVNSQSQDSLSLQPSRNSEDRFNVQTTTTSRDIINSQSNIYSRDRVNGQSQDSINLQPILNSGDRFNLQPNTNSRDRGQSSTGSRDTINLQPSTSSRDRVNQPSTSSRDTTSNQQGSQSGSRNTVNSLGINSGNEYQTTRRNTAARDNICGTVIPRPRPLIAYGEITHEGEFPWHAALYLAKDTRLTYICGASLISRNHVVTAAHCVVKAKPQKSLEPRELIVQLGKYNLKRFSVGFQDRQVSEIIAHPQFSAESYRNDIALLRFDTAANVTDYVRPICLWQESTDINVVLNKIGKVVGWGYDETGEISEELMQAKMPVIPKGKCISSYPDFYTRFTSSNSYCAGFANGTSPCNGDAGGGMVFPISDSNPYNPVWQLRGLISILPAFQNQFMCDVTHYAIFTDVAKYLDWIALSM